MALLAGFNRCVEPLAGRLARGARVLLELPGTYRVVGGGAKLLRGMASAGSARNAYDVLYHYVSLGLREQARRYCQWVARTETTEDAYPANVILAASLDGLEDRHLRLTVANIRASVRGGTVILNAETPRLQGALDALRVNGVRALPMAAMADALIGDAAGIVFLGRGYCLHRNSLSAITRALDDGADVVYGDADRLDVKGVRGCPYFKPDFSPDLLFHEDYLSDCIGVSRRIWNGEWRFDDPHGSVLRMAVAARRIDHLPVILSHALTGGPKKPSLRPPEYLEELLRGRYGPAAGIEATPSGWRCRFRTAVPAHVTVVIPTRDRIDLLAPCVDSLYATNAGGVFDVIVVDNGSREPATREWLARVERDRADFRVLAADIEFNWSRLNNLAIAEAGGDVVVLLNNDTVSKTCGWLDRIAEYAMRDDVGVVGPLLLYPDGTIQHAGVVVGYGGCSDHLFNGTSPAVNRLMFVSPMVPRNVSLVTGACLAVSRKVIDSIGLFDEAYRVVGSDGEFCLRAHRMGLRNVYLPEIVLLHHESQSRSRSDPASDTERLRRLVADQMPHDPFYNPNLTLASLYPSLSAQPRVAR